MHHVNCNQQRSVYYPEPSSCRSSSCPRSAVKLFSKQIRQLQSAIRSLQFLSPLRRSCRSGPSSIRQGHGAFFSAGHSSTSSSESIRKLCSPSHSVRTRSYRLVRPRQESSFFRNFRRPRSSCFSTVSGYDSDPLLRSQLPMDATSRRKLSRSSRYHFRRLEGLGRLFLVIAGILAAFFAGYSSASGLTDDVQCPSRNATFPSSDVAFQELCLDSSGTYSCLWRKYNVRHCSVELPVETSITVIYFLLIFLIVLVVLHKFAHLFLVFTQMFANLRRPPLSVPLAIIFLLPFALASPPLPYALSDFISPISVCGPRFVDFLSCMPQAYQDQCKGVALCYTSSSPRPTCEAALPCLSSFNCTGFDPTPCLHIFSYPFESCTFDFSRPSSYPSSPDGRPLQIFATPDLSLLHLPHTVMNDSYIVNSVSMSPAQLLRPTSYRAPNCTAGVIPIISSHVRPQFLPGVAPSQHRCIAVSGIAVDQYLVIVLSPLVDPLPSSSHLLYAIQFDDYSSLIASYYITSDLPCSFSIHAPFGSLDVVFDPHFVNSVKFVVPSVDGITPNHLHRVIIFSNSTSLDHVPYSFGSSLNAPLLAYVAARTRTHPLLRRPSIYFLAVPRAEDGDLHEFVGNNSLGSSRVCDFDSDPSCRYTRWLHQGGSPQPYAPLIIFIIIVAFIPTLYNLYRLIRTLFCIPFSFIDHRMHARLSYLFGLSPFLPSDDPVMTTIRLRASRPGRNHKNFLFAHMIFHSFFPFVFYVYTLLLMVPLISFQLVFWCLLKRCPKSTIAYSFPLIVLFHGAYASPEADYYIAPSPLQSTLNDTLRSVHYMPVSSNYLSVASRESVRTTCDKSFCHDVHFYDFTMDAVKSSHTMFSTGDESYIFFISDAFWKCDIEQVRYFTPDAVVQQTFLDSCDRAFYCNDLRSPVDVPFTANNICAQSTNAWPIRGSPSSNAYYDILATVGWDAGNVLHGPSTCAVSASRSHNTALGTCEKCYEWKCSYTSSLECTESWVGFNVIPSSCSPVLFVGVQRNDELLGNYRLDLSRHTSISVGDLIFDITATISPRLSSNQDLFIVDDPPETTGSIYDSSVIDCSAHTPDLITNPSSYLSGYSVDYYYNGFRGNNYRSVSSKIEDTCSSSNDFVQSIIRKGGSSDCTTKAISTSRTWSSHSTDCLGRSMPGVSDRGYHLSIQSLIDFDLSGQIHASVEITKTRVVVEEDPVIVLPTENVGSCTVTSCSGTSGIANGITACLHQDIEGTSPFLYISDAVLVLHSSCAQLSSMATNPVVYCGYIVDGQLHYISSLTCDSTMRSINSSISDVRPEITRRSRQYGSSPFEGFGDFLKSIISGVSDLGGSLIKSSPLFDTIIIVALVAGLILLLFVGVPFIKSYISTNSSKSFSLTHL